MQISTTSSGRIDTAVGVSASIAAAAAVVNDPAGGLDGQVQAYRALSRLWDDGAGSRSDRTTLVQALTQSPFAQKVQSALNGFTRQAWAGADATPAEANGRMLQAFDSLSETDQTLVAAFQPAGRDGAAAATPAAFRARLQSDAQGAQAGATRRGDSITLSAAARAQLAGIGLAPTNPAPSAETPAATPALSVALKAYAKADQGA